MKNIVKNTIMGILIWMCIIWLCVFDPSQLWAWFKVAICLAGITVFFWWIFDFSDHFAGDEDESI